MKTLILIFIALISTTTLFFTINSKTKETVVIVESYDNYALNLGKYHQLLFGNRN